MIRPTADNAEISVMWGKYAQAVAVFLARGGPIATGKGYTHPMTRPTADNAVSHVQRG